MLNREDEQLLKEAQLNPNNYNKLYDKYHQKVYNYFWFRNGHDKEKAEDMMQDVFMKAFQKLDGFKLKKCSYLTYLLTIAHNLLVNYYRDSSREGIVNLEKIPEIIANFDNDKVDLELMWKKIYKLPLIEKDALLLRFRQELPIKEISLILNKSENAVKLIISRAKKRLISVAELGILAEIPNNKKAYIEPKFHKKS